MFHILLKHSLFSFSQTKSIELSFSDGTSVTAKNVYLTMLPFDLPTVDGLEPWSEALDKYADPGLATKIVLGWNDKASAPPARLGATPCVSSNGCERFIFSGNNNDPEDPWMIRQFWLWDEYTIMVSEYNKALKPRRYLS